MKDDQEEIELGNGAEDGADDGDGEGVDDVLDKDLDTSTVPFEKSDDSIPTRCRKTTTRSRPSSKGTSSRITPRQILHAKPLS